MSSSRKANVIQLRGVRHNNLKGFDLDIPMNKLVVITGLSGSGKSSLAFDTLYAEGQRRYIETFSPYARQFFDRMDKPRVDSIDGIPPAIAIQQRNAVRSTRSTVGTMTEICDHMKVLWRYIAQLHCRKCSRPVHRESPQMVWKTFNAEHGTRNVETLVTFEVPLSKKLSLDESLALIAKQGYQRLLVSGEVVRLEDAAGHSAFRVPHSALTLVQDRLRLTPANRTRFIEACEQAYHFGKGKLRIHPAAGPGHLADNAKRSTPHNSTIQRFSRSPRDFSNRLHCPGCDIDYTDPSPALFSFNHPVGACPACKGFGRIITIDYNLAIPDRSRTLKEGVVKPWQSGMSAECQRDLMKFCRATGVPTGVPFNELSHEHQRWIIEGDPDYGVDEEHEWPKAWYGIKGYFRWLESKSYKMHVRVLLSRYRAYTTCPDCQGARLKPDALLYTIDDLRLGTVASELRRPRKSEIENRKLSLADFYALPVSNAAQLIDHLCRDARISNSGIEHALREVQSRLRYLREIGLGYLTLDRATRSLSGGETERVNLAGCLGTRLVNTLFVLDEPSVGLHPRDTGRLVKILEALRDEGNAVVIVEHERSVMEAADQIIDLGPGHGATGGNLVFQGAHSRILKSPTSLTGKYLSGRTTIKIPDRRPIQHTAGIPPADPAADRARDTEAAAQLHDATYKASGNSAQCVAPGPRWMRIEHANRHNLRDLTLEIPLSRFVCISGVSGSGKSTLIRDVLLPTLQQQLGTNTEAARASDRMDDEDRSPAQSSRHHAVRITGVEHLSNVVLVDQSILGKTPRSNPAVYTGAFDHIRELFAQCEEARRQGLNASAFSFNSAQGQCERCRGAGFEKVEMQFLSDVFIRCPDCNGRRYREHILEVRMGDTGIGDQDQKSVPRSRSRNTPLPRGSQKEKPGHTTGSLSIADLLESTVDEAIEFLAGFPHSKPATRAKDSLGLLQDVGLGYLALGQPINTLSGGESQRLKLVRHLAESSAVVPAALQTSVRNGSRDSHATLFLLDEPTTGLHFDDIRILLDALQRLVDAGHSLVVIEHNLDVLKCADWVIDLGPEAGDAGGQLVVAGTPETVISCRASHTGNALRKVLSQHGRRRRHQSKPSKRTKARGGGPRQ